MLGTILGIVTLIIVIVLLLVGALPTCACIAEPTGPARVAGLATDSANHPVT